MTILAWVLGGISGLVSLIKLYSSLVKLIGKEATEKLLLDGAECSRELLELKDANLPFDEKAERRYEILDKYPNFWGRALK